MVDATLAVPLARDRALAILRRLLQSRLLFLFLHWRRSAFDRATEPVIGRFARI